MENQKRKRGRPRKYPPIDKSIVKRSRGRPKKQNSVAQDVEKYVPLKRDLRTYQTRFDKKIFMELVKRFKGDLCAISYVIDQCMKEYIKNPRVMQLDKLLQSKWSFQTNVIKQPFSDNELTLARFVIGGVPLQYKYLIIIDYDIYSQFESASYKNSIYSTFLLNELVKLYINGKLNIITEGAESWFEQD